MLNYKVVKSIKQKLNSIEFMGTHKANPTDFTRSSKLNFYNLIILILRKSVKSIQLFLNEFILQTNKNFTITAGAFTKARKKLKHSAFIELNQDVINLFYSEKKEEVKRFKGYRLFGFDGSKINVPKNEETIKHFGLKNTKNKSGSSSYVQATYEACYDLLNNISVGNILEKANVYEASLAEKIFNFMSAKDVGVFDRAYMSYNLMAKMIYNNTNFVMRCQRCSFYEIQEMFELEEDTGSKVIELWPAYKNIGKVRCSDLPNTIKVRLIKITLPTGEPEVLITSLINEEELSIEDFAEIYRLRWGVETYFSKIKGRLNLENFTGKSVEAIFQDFWSTIFISNLETVIIDNIEHNLDKKTCHNKHKRKVNKAVSFNAIKNKVFELFYCSSDVEATIKELECLFLTNTIPIRKGRTSERKVVSSSVSARYQRCYRKHVF